MAMSIKVTCIECDTSHSVNENMAGRKIRCPNCDTVVHVPEADVALIDDTNAREEVVTEAVVTEEVGTAEVEDFAEVPALTIDPFIATSPLHHSTHQDPSETHLLVLDDEDDDDEVLVRSKRPEEEIDMTPMVDVTFLLLIFFMVTAAFSLQKSIQMPRQQTDVPSTNIEEEIDELDVVEIQVDEFGSFLVMAPGFERETPGKQNLITALREAIAGTRDGMRLDIKVHESAKLHALVDAMDAGTIAGYADLHVMQVEEFD